MQEGAVEQSSPLQEVASAGLGRRGGPGAGGPDPSTSGGPGKTSTARILAKAVNCLSPQEGQPCNVCALCASIADGAAMDLVEIDAASNRGIDDIRNLREKIYYAPSQARFKVYIVDEVHMLTDAAFNALLKTLEEPPAHAIFVLATTEPHRVPATVASRCQRFDFRRIAPGATVERLRSICDSEGAAADDEALWAIAKAASGSLRDAVNLLDQMIVSYGGEFGAAHVQDLLGLGDEEAALRVVECVLSGDLPEGLGVIHAASINGADLRQFHRQVVEYLRAALLVRSGAEGGLDYTADALERLKTAAAGLDVETLVRAVKLFSLADVRAGLSSPLPLELALVEASLKAPSPLSAASAEGPRPPGRAAAPQVAARAADAPSAAVSSPEARGGGPGIADSIHGPAPAPEEGSQPGPSPAAIAQNLPAETASQGEGRTPAASSSNERPAP